MIDHRARIEILKSIDSIFDREHIMTLHADGSGSIITQESDGEDWHTDWLGEGDMISRIFGWVSKEKMLMAEFKKENK